MLLTDEMKIRIPYALHIPERAFVHLLRCPTLPAIGDVALAEVKQIWAGIRGHVGCAGAGHEPLGVAKMELGSSSPQERKRAYNTSRF
jgi:hypothetical protein